MFRCRHSNWTLGTLIPGKPHSRVKSRNSRVSIETLDFALRTFTCVIEAGLLAGASDDAGQSVNVAGEWAHETAGSGRVSGAMAHVETHAGKAMGECDHQPDARLRETTGPPSHRAGRSADIAAVGTFDVCSNVAVNSDLSYFLYTGRLKPPYLHCGADTVA